MSGRFVTTLRTRTAPIRLVNDGAPLVWTLRVQSAEVWDTIKIEVAPDVLVRDVKQAAMGALMPDVDAIDEYVIKLGGFEIVNEGVSVQSSGAIDGSTLLLMSRRRRAVR